MFRQLIFALQLTFAIVLPRSLLITSAHSECYDDDYRVTRSGN